jgi:flagellar hook assembly protein FlgD
MSTNPVSGAAGTSTQNSTGTDSFKQLGTKDFINMLVKELQNQDPTNPMKSSELIQEMSQIQAIESNQQLSSTLQSVVLGQNLATAGALMNQTVTGLADSGNTVTGTVQSVTIDNGAAKLNVGSDIIGLGNVSEILPPRTGGS